MEEHKAVDLAASIVTSNAYGRGFHKDELIGALRDLTQTIQELSQTKDVAVEIVTFKEPEEAERPMDWKKSIGVSTVTCLICGKTAKVLAPHLKRAHQLDTKAYKKQFGIPGKISLISRTIRIKRSKMAKELGLGDKLKTYREEKKKA